MPTIKKDKGAGEYAREAVQHWGRAVRHGAAALASRRKTSRGGGIGHIAESAVGKLGAALPGGGQEENGSIATAELPIQQSIDIAVPVSAVFALCTQFEQYPEFLDRVESVEPDGDSLLVSAKIGGGMRELTIDVMDERPDERLDWECDEGFEHSGVISLHPLAPRLTRLELTVERQPETLAERLARKLGLTEGAMQEELRRFKAYAELWEEADEYESADTEVSDEGDVEGEEGEEEEPEEDEEEPEEDEKPKRAPRRRRRTAATSGRSRS